MPHVATDPQLPALAVVPTEFASTHVASVIESAQEAASMHGPLPMVLPRQRPFYSNRTLVNGPLNCRTVRFPASVQQVILAELPPPETELPELPELTEQPAPVQPAPAPTAQALLTTAPLELGVLYLFAGKVRKADIREHLQSLCDQHGTVLHMVEVDTVRDAVNHDMAASSPWNSVLQRVENREFQIVIATPPCNTHSRVVWANTAGPRPIRSRQWPMGFPWLEGANLEKCRLANLLVERSIQICSLAASVGSFYLLAHPEDLGTTMNGGDPTSIWSLEEMFQLQRETNATTMSFFQCEFGLDAQKPTRLMGTLPLLAKRAHCSWPRFSKVGKYLGPLPPGCGHRHSRKMTGRAASGEFHTSSTAAYPPEMCFWLSSMIFDAFQSQSRLKMGQDEFLDPVTNSATTPTRTVSLVDRPSGVSPLDPAQSDPMDVPTSDEEEPGIPRPKLRPAGRGPPLKARWGGKTRDIHDGAGLCSPGRWKPKDRIVPEWKGLQVLKERWMALIATHIPDVSRAVATLACAKATASPSPPATESRMTCAWLIAFQHQPGEGTIP